MLGCVLRLSGPREELAASLRDAFVVFEEARAAVRARDRGEDDGYITFSHVVSDADGDQVPVQISDAEAFLTNHTEALAELRSRRGVESAVLDFGWEIPSDAVGPWNRFPSSLLSLCVAAGVEIEVSVYRGDDRGSVQ